MLIYKLFYDIIEVEPWEVRTTNVYFMASMMAHISSTLRRAIVRGVSGRKSGLGQNRGTLRAISLPPPINNLPTLLLIPAPERQN